MTEVIAPWACVGGPALDLAPAGRAVSGSFADGDLAVCFRQILGPVDIEKGVGGPCPKDHPNDGLPGLKLGHPAEAVAR